MGNQRFSITPAKAATDTNLPDSVFRTLAVIGMYGDKEGWCWPSQKTLANARGVTRQTIHNHTKILIERGYLNIHSRYDEETGAQKSNMMQIKFDFEPDFTGGVKPKVLQGVSNPELYRGGKTQDFTHNAPENETNNGSSAGAAFTAYENEIGPLTQMTSEAVGEAVDEYGQNLVIQAIEEASRNNVRKWSYAEACLKNWKVNGRGKRKSNPVHITKINNDGSIFG